MYYLNICSKNYQDNNIEISEFLFSNQQKIPSPSNLSQTRENKLFANPELDYEPCSTMTQVMISTFHAKKPDYLLIKETSFISLAKMTLIGKI